MEGLPSRALWFSPCHRASSAMVGMVPDLFSGADWHHYGKRIKIWPETVVISSMPGFGKFFPAVTMVLRMSANCSGPFTALRANRKTTL